MKQINMLNSLAELIRFRNGERNYVFDLETVACYCEGSGNLEVYLVKPRLGEYKRVTQRGARNVLAAYNKELEEEAEEYDEKMKDIDFQATLERVGQAYWMTNEEADYCGLSRGDDRNIEFLEI
ncbi:hypothetical protein KY330_00535 [Candidatus Woesearchaeota archaeon]|nr:hypothetical protein [Candidatus Woesearchaeota archaeon]